MNDNRSVATIDGPEFIDIHPYNPLISECQIKVMYVGKNRNGSYIDKNTAIQMANSLPGCPIVGYFKEDTQDFADHGQVMTIEGGEIKFSCKTKPYGFVSPDARVWFQKFIDTDEFGQDIEREYMMTTGYLWTGQFEEAKSVIQEGKGQSMELDPDTLDGHWANDVKTEMDFFIINDALFSKLCILGDDVEPCFEGASVSAKYSADDSFARSLYSMMKELQEALGQTEGGSYMPNKQEELQETESDFVVTSAGAVVSEGASVEEAVEETPVESAAEVIEEVVETVAEPTAPAAPAEAKAKPAVETAEVTEEFAKKEEDEAPSEKTDEPEESEDEKPEDAEDAPADEKEEDKDEDKKPASKHSLSEDEAIMAELAELREFKLNYERAQKDEVINKYHMLSDEDKAEVVSHKDEYTLEQIDEKLALVYVRKNVDFSTVDGRPEVEETVEEAPLLAFSLDDSNIIDNAEPVDGLHEALRELFN
jgi:hypothetical protein